MKLRLIHFIFCVGLSLASFSTLRSNEVPGNVPELGSTTCPMIQPSTPVPSSTTDVPTIQNAPEEEDPVEDPLQDAIYSHDLSLQTRFEHLTEEVELLKAKLAHLSSKIRESSAFDDTERYVMFGLACLTVFLAVVGLYFQHQYNNYTRDIRDDFRKVNRIDEDGNPMTTGTAPPQDVRNNNNNGEEGGGGRLGIEGPFPRILQNSNFGDPP